MKPLILVCLVSASLASTAWAQGADDCAAAPDISGEGTWPFDATGATTDGSPAVLCQFHGSDDVLHDIWFRWTAQTSGDFEITLNPVDSFMGHKFAVYDDSCPSAVLLACEGGFYTLPLEGAVAGTSYLIRIGSTVPGVVGTLTVVGGTHTPPTILNPINGNHYRLVPSFGIWWDNAKLRAENETFMGEQGHLAAIQDADENQFVFGLDPDGADYYWLGGFQDVNAPDYLEPRGGWRWVTGEPWCFTDWAFDGPYNQVGADNYLAYSCIFCPEASWRDYEQVINLEVTAYGYLIEFETGGQCIGGAGAKYCVAGTNSLGLEAEICAVGSPVVAEDELCLSAVNLPPGTFGMFFYGTRSAFATLGGGFRCVSGHPQRIRPPQVADAAGRASLRVDFTTPPYAMDFLPGEIRYFQYWYRDGAASSNLTDGVQVTFE